LLNESNWSRSLQAPAHAGSSLVDFSFFFYPEDVGDTFFRNVGSYYIYTAPHPRRWHSLNRTCDVCVQTEWKVFASCKLKMFQMRNSRSLDDIHLLSLVCPDQLLCFVSETCFSSSSQVFSGIICLLMMSWLAVQDCHHLRCIALHSCVSWAWVYSADAAHSKRADSGELGSSTF
jgi:hypothetical protein